MPPDPPDVLEYGDDAVASGDTALEYGDEAATVPGSSRGAKPKQSSAGGSRVFIIYAGGFRDRTPADEVDALKASGTGSIPMDPTTIYFRETANHSRPFKSQPASSTAEFLNAFELAAASQVSRVVFVGHGNTGGLLLSGSMGANDFDVTELQNHAAQLRALGAKLTPKGTTIDLVACSNSPTGDFAQQLANVTGLTVRFYPGEVTWCTRLSDSGKSVEHWHFKIGGQSKFDCSDPKSGWLESVTPLPGPWDSRHPVV